MSDRTVVTERRGDVLLITLNRPDRRNAFNAAQAQGLADAMDLLDNDDALRVGVLAGAGRGFSAGMDLNALLAGENAWIGDRGFAGIVQQPSRKVLIAAIEGFAVAGGLEVALACDLIVAGRSAKLGVPEVTRALVAAGGALLRLPQRVGHGTAVELVLTGDTIDAERGKAIGLVDRLVPDGDAVAEALALADRITANGPLALVVSKQILQSASHWTYTEFWAKQAELVAPIFASEDAREGSVAFAEKRVPVWTGH